MDIKSTKSIDNVSLSCEESVSNSSNTDGECEDSSSDVEGIHYVYNEFEEELLLESEIEKKRKILKFKREELRDRLMSYKLMQFNTNSQTSHLYSIPAKHCPRKPEFKVPASPTPAEADSTSPSSPQSSFTDAFNPGPFAGTFNPHEYGFREDDIAMAIQASLDEMTRIQAIQRLSPPLEDEHLVSGISQTQSGNQNYSDALPGTSQSSELLIANNPLHRWNTGQPGTEIQNPHREAGSDVQEIDPVQEDFMEGERYVGDKGKRPLSGKYSYKKRSKSSQVDSNEQPSKSNLPKDDRSVE